jgi:hypothetical protein
MTSIISCIESLILEEYKPRVKSTKVKIIDKSARILLNERFSKIEHVPRLKTTLFEHQKTVVSAMLDMEKKRQLKIYSVKQNQYVTLSYNVCILSEPVGSGKTIDILALCCLSNKPRAIPDITELIYPTDTVHVGIVKRKFKRLLSPTIIFVGVSVLNQWESAISTFTDFDALIVRDVHGLKLLLSLIESRGINAYDIVLVKNGKITVPIELFDDIELEDKNKVGQPYIYNIIANLREYIWARVVIDDFDTIKLPHNANIIVGLFTWYISSTRKMTQNREVQRKYTSASDYLTNQDYGCSNILLNNLLFEFLNVRNHDEFIKQTTSLPIIKYHVVIFKNPNNGYISLLASMADDTVTKITDMLNADAIGAAADAAGIRSTSVVDIFEKLLGDKFEQYRFATAVVDFITMEEGRADEREEVTDEDPKYGKKRLLSFESIDYKYPNIDKLLTETKIQYTEIKTTAGTAIQRVKDNIAHGECPVCRSNLQDVEEFIILKCCGLVLCGNCGIKGQKMNDRFNKLSGVCSQCRAPLTIKDMIYLSDNFNLDNLLEENFEDTNVKVEANTIVEIKENTKYTSIIDILYAQPMKEAKHVDMCLANMMKGNRKLPEAPVRKLLVFANYDETLTSVIKTLDDEKITYWKLQGSASELSAISVLFNSSKESCVLVINSTKHCSGLNLQTATDLIFMHCIKDLAIESQVAGRGHRLGRNSPLNIWYLTYDNEYETLCKTRSVRELNSDEILELGPPPTPIQRRELNDTD